MIKVEVKENLLNIYQELLLLLELLVSLLETHQDPDNAPSDGPNMVPLDKLDSLIKQIVEIDNLIKKLMSKITKVVARQVFDSRGNPTVEAEVY